MSQASRTGNIYDLGYRPYDGQRLGRSYATTSLFWYSLKSIFGLGRSGWAKVFPIGFFVIAMLPSIVQLGFAALAPEDFDLFRPEEILGYTSLILFLFCATAAPDLIGRDYRARTLALYFSRALSRIDYVSAKLAALVTSVFIVTFIPQVLLVFGEALASNDITDYFSESVKEWPAILASSAVVSLLFASVSLAIAVLTSRRAISTGSVLGYFIIFGLMGSILLHTAGDSGSLLYLVSPSGVAQGVTYWLFNVSPPLDSDLATADLRGFIYLFTAFAYIGAAGALLYRRFLRMSL